MSLNDLYKKKDERKKEVRKIINKWFDNWFLELQKNPEKWNESIDNVKNLIANTAHQSREEYTFEIFNKTSQNIIYFPAEITASDHVHINRYTILTSDRIKNKNHPLYNTYFTLFIRKGTFYININFGESPGCIIF